MTEPTKELIPVSCKELVQDALYFCNSISMIVITTQDEYLENCELTKKITKYANEIKEDYKLLVKPLDEQKAEIKSFFDTAVSPLKNLREKLRISLADYTEKQRQKRIKAQRKADAEAEKERLRLEKQAKKDAEKSQKAAENGDHAKAEELNLRSTVRQDMAEAVTPVVIPKEIPKVKGISYRTDWSAKVVDKKKFIEACLQSNQLQYININMKELNAFAKVYKLAAILPGVEFTSKTTPVTR